MFIRLLRTAGARFRLVLLAARGMVNTCSQAGFEPWITCESSKGLKSLSQLVFVSSMAISQHDRIAVFQAGDELATVQFKSTVASFYVVRFVVLAVLT